MTEMPSGRPSEPRTGPATPAPAHGDGPTRPSTPTGHTGPCDNEITVTITADTSGFESALKDARIATLELAVTELTRRAEEAERERDQARDAIADERRGRLAAEAAVRRVRALHQPTKGMGYDCDEDDTPGSYGDIAQVCTSCGTADEYGVRWPCPTIAALNAEEPR